MPPPGKERNQTYIYSDYISWPDEERWELIDGAAYNEPADNTVMIYKPGDNAEYGKPRMFSKDDKITSPILKGLEIDLKPVFA